MKIRQAKAIIVTEAPQNCSNMRGKNAWIMIHESFSITIQDDKLKSQKHRYRLICLKIKTLQKPSKNSTIHYLYDNSAELMS